MKSHAFVWLLLTLALPTFAAKEEPIDHRFRRQAPDTAMGDWAGDHIVAQVVPNDDGTYEANLFRAFDQPDDKPLTVLHGRRNGEALALAGDDWAGTLVGSALQVHHRHDAYTLHPVQRTPPTLGAKPPAGAVVLFDGTSMAAFAAKDGKQWLKENGPAPWRIVDGALEVVPGTGGGIITHQQFGDFHLHVEFRTLGAPTNSGVYLETRYEANINESYGRLAGSANGGFDNCTNSPPRIRASLPPLAWQTFDIDFTAPRFDSAGHKTADATATLLLNGVRLYDHQPLNRPKGAAGRLGEAPTGPLMLQEHGMPVQFRNIWLVPARSP